MQGIGCREQGVHLHGAGLLERCPHRPPISPLTTPSQIKGGLRDVAQGHGVAVRTGARVERIMTEACGGGAGQRATGVVLEGGEHIKADAVVSNRWGRQ